MRRINILLLQTSISQSPSAALRDKNVSDTAHTNIVSAQLIYLLQSSRISHEVQGDFLISPLPFPFFFVLLNLHLLPFPMLKVKQNLSRQQQS